MTTTTYLCIGCPLGCRLEVDEDEEGAIVEVRGFGCRRGKLYAEQEHTAPRRMVTTTLAISGARHARIPVKSSAPVPKDLVPEICRVARGHRVVAPVRMGDVLVANILATAVDLIATCDMPAVY